MIDRSGDRSRRPAPGRRGAWAALALLLLCWLPAAGAKVSDAEAARRAELVVAPRALVEQTIGQVLVILNEEGLSSTERRGRIENIAFEVFDFKTMGKLVLARNWKKLDAEQRKEFIQEFKRHLSRNYGSRLDRYQQTDVAIAATRVEPRDDVTVESKVVGGQFDGIEMNYRLRAREGTWKVIDVVIEGVSLIANFRSQFKEVMSSGGPEALLEQMREKNEQPLEEESA